MTWPFVDPKPLGWGLFEELTSAEITQINANAAAAADGSVWTDLAHLRNFRAYQPLSLGGGPTEFGRCPTYDPVTRRWLIFGVNPASTPVVAHTISGSSWVSETSIAGGAPGAAVAPRSSWTNNAGVTLVGCVTSGAGTAHKIRESTNGGATWTYRSIGAADASSVVSITYSESLGIWVATQDVDEPGIWSSTDRITWTKRSAIRQQKMTVRDGASPLFQGFGVNAVSTSYMTSPDGINWTTNTFPADTGGGRQGAWSSHYDAFFQSSSSGGLYRSSTGLTGSWTLVDSFGNTHFGSIGRALVRGDGKASIDGGVTWIPILETTETALLPVCREGVGMIITENVGPGDVYVSFVGGF